MKDEVLKEIHQIKDTIAREHRNNVREMLQAARRRQAAGNRPIRRVQAMREAA
jgi:hypothetical protein